MKSNEEMIRCVKDQIHEKKQKTKKQRISIINSEELLKKTDDEMRESESCTFVDCVATCLFFVILVLESFRER